MNTNISIHPESSLPVEPKKSARRLFKPDGHNKWLVYSVQLVGCLALSLVFGSILILSVGEDPLNVFRIMFQEAFFTPLGLMITIQRATPLILTAAAAVLAFQGGAINMGLAGQFMVGGAVASLAGTVIPEMPKLLAVPIVLFFCALGGAAAGWVPAFFKMASGVSEVITGMIANLILPHVLSFFLGLPIFRMLRAGAAQHGLAPWATLNQFSELTNGAIGSGTRANTGIFVAIGLVIFLAITLKRTKIGYEIRMACANFSMAEFGGIRSSRTFYMTLMLSGAIAAIGGATEVLGTWQGGSGGTISTDYNGLLVALAGGNTFIGALIASIFLGGMQSGAMNISWVTNIPRPLIDILAELLILFAAIPSMRLFFSGSTFSDVERLGGQFTKKDR